MTEPKRLPIHEAADLLRTRAPEVERRVDLGDEPWSIEDEESFALVYDGDVRVDGDFAVGGDPVIVLGSLDVTGWLSDCEESDVSLLLVAGHVRADRALFCGQVVIGGDLEVATIVYANSLNDWSLDVFGDLRAAALVEEGMHCEIGGQVVAPRVLSLQNSIVQGAARSPVVRRRATPTSSVLRADLLDGDYPDMGKVRAAMQANRPVLV